MTFGGLTWDHPRGHDALAEAARCANQGREQPLLIWNKQPLEGFEFAPMARLAADYDVLVVDHPHVGEAAVEDCLVPLEDLFSVDQLRTWQSVSVGRALTSYRWQDRTFALLFDVASQVVAGRPDPVDAPDGWDEIMRLPPDIGIAQSLAGPHALLTLNPLADIRRLWQTARSNARGPLDDDRGSFT